MGDQHVQYSSTSHVRVLVRIRPALPDEYKSDEAVEVLSATGIRVQNAKQSFESSYDRVLSATSSQQAVFEQVKDCASLLLQGYNNTVLAYGQTGTGKTYTIVGDQRMTIQQACRIPCSTSAHGILPRVVSDLFTQLESRNSAFGSSQYEVKLVCSYLEVYNDKLYDLLSPYKKGACRDPYRIQTGKTRLEVREDPVAGTYVPNLLYVDVKNCKQVLQLLAAGNRNRATAHTDMNRHSSRSHAIMQLWLEQRPRPPASTSATAAQCASAADGVVIRSKMNFVDLAGSERWGKAHAAAEDKTLVSELTSINNSLSALALVVSALSDKTARHVPYRSSLLTHLLQDSLGGNCNTTLLVTIAPCVNAFEESIAALKFADRARNVSNKAVINSMQDTESILALKEREIQRLRALLATYTSAAGIGASISAPGTAPQEQLWDAIDMRQQDALLLPTTTPGTPSHAASADMSLGLSLPPCSPSSIADRGRQLSPLSSTALEMKTSSWAGIEPPGIAYNMAELESELAATRAALVLERTMRSALEGQLQEVSAKHLQQQAASTSNKQQDTLADAILVQTATEQKNSKQEPAVVPPTSSLNTTSGYTSSLAGNAPASNAAAAAAAPVAADAACMSTHNKETPTWPLLTSQNQPPHKQRMILQDYSKASEPAPAKQRQLPGWNDHWQGSAEDRDKTQNRLRKANAANNSSRSTPQSPTCGKQVSPKRPATQQQLQRKAASTRRDVLRSSWPTMLGPSVSPTAKSPKPTAAPKQAVLLGHQRQCTGRSCKPVLKPNAADLLENGRFVSAGNKFSDVGVMQKRVVAGASSEQHVLLVASNGPALRVSTQGRGGTLQLDSILVSQQQHMLQVATGGQQGWGRSWLLKQLGQASVPAESLPSTASPAPPAGNDVQAASGQLVNRPVSPSSLEQDGSVQQLQDLLQQQQQARNQQQMQAQQLLQQQARNQQQMQAQQLSAVEQVGQDQLRQVQKQQPAPAQEPSEHEAWEEQQMYESSSELVQPTGDIIEDEVDGVPEVVQTTASQDAGSTQPQQCESVASEHVRTSAPASAQQTGASMVEEDSMGISDSVEEAWDPNADAGQSLELQQEVVDEEYSDDFSEQLQDDSPARPSDDLIGNNE